MMLIEKLHAYNASEYWDELDGLLGDAHPTEWDEDAIAFVQVDENGIVGELPPDVIWHAEQRIVLLRAKRSRHLLVECNSGHVDVTLDSAFAGTAALIGSGSGNVSRSGSAQRQEHNPQVGHLFPQHGSYGAVRVGDGPGNAICTSDGPGDARRVGRGPGDAVRSGKGPGDAVVIGAIVAESGGAQAIRGGGGHAIRDGGGNGSAEVECEGSGNAIRKGAGNGDALHFGAGPGVASREGSGSGNAVCVAPKSSDAQFLSEGDGEAIHVDADGNPAEFMTCEPGGGRSVFEDDLPAQAAWGAEQMRDMVEAQMHNTDQPDAPDLTCQRPVQATKRPCLLQRDHRGHCRSVLR